MQWARFVKLNLTRGELCRPILQTVGVFQYQRSRNLKSFYLSILIEADNNAMAMPKFFANGDATHPYCSMWL